MISLEQLREKAKRKYWWVLKSMLREESIFPLVMRADKKLPESFGAMHRVIGELVAHSFEKTGKGYRLDFAERKTRKHGMQTVPVRIWFESFSDYLVFIRKKGEAEKILEQAEQLCSAIPQLTDWVHGSPRKIFTYLDHCCCRDVIC